MIWINGFILWILCYQVYSYKLWYVFCTYIGTCRRCNFRSNCSGIDQSLRKHRFRSYMCCLFHTRSHPELETVSTFKANLQWAKGNTKATSLPDGIQDNSKWCSHRAVTKVKERFRIRFTRCEWILRSDFGRKYLVPLPQHLLKPLPISLLTKTYVRRYYKFQTWLNDDVETVLGDTEVGAEHELRSVIRNNYIFIVCVTAQWPSIVV